MTSSIQMPGKVSYGDKKSTTNRPGIASKKIYHLKAWVCQGYAVPLGFCINLATA